MNSKYIGNWFELAIKDVEVSNILHKKKYYSNSFYHFQQASEKGIKGYAFLTGKFTNENDAFKTGHYTVQIFKKTIKEIPKSIESLRNTNIDFLIDNKDLDDYFNKAEGFDSVLPNREENLYIQKNFIVDSLKFCDSISKIDFDFSKNLKNEFKLKFPVYLSWLKNQNPHSAILMEQEYNKLCKNEILFNGFFNDIRNVIKNELIISYCLIVLIYCNFISHNHNTSCRYPSEDFNPLHFYNLKKPIIKMLPELNIHLSKSLRHLAKINKRNSPIPN